MKPLLPFAQILISLLLVVAILIQQRGTALGSSFGQEGGFYATRRGIEKKIFYLTVVLVVLFIATALANLIL